MLDEFKKDTRVVHCNKEPYDVYIGRPSEWGNPYTHIKDKSTLAEYVVRNREEAVRKYKDWLLSQHHLMEKIESLRGKTLGCWCSPKSCHGDIIIEVLNDIQARRRTD